MEILVKKKKRIVELLDVIECLSLLVLDVMEEGFCKSLNVGPKCYSDNEGYQHASNKIIASKTRGMLACSETEGKIAKMGANFRVKSGFSLHVTFVLYVS